MKSRLIAASVAAMAASAMAGASAASVPQQPAPVPREAREESRRRREVRSDVGSSWWYLRKGPGWTVAKVKRMARKRRNVLRHRAHCKGKRSR